MVSRTSGEPSPVMSATSPATPSTASRRPHDSPQTGRHGLPPSSNRRHAATPPGAANGSSLGIVHATTIASPAEVDVSHEPLTRPLSGTSAATGTSPVPTSSSKPGGRPAGSDGDGVVGAAVGVIVAADGVGAVGVEVPVEGPASVHAAAVSTITRTAGRRRTRPMVGGPG